MTRENAVSAPLWHFGNSKNASEWKNHSKKSREARLLNELSTRQQTLRVRPGGGVQPAAKTWQI
jgi:hypothetical protein